MKMDDVSVYQGGQVVGGWAVVAIGGEKIVLGGDFFAYDFVDQLRLWGHELAHIIQARTVPLYGQLLGSFNRYYGYFRNPLEVSAEWSGAAFASQILEKAITPDDRYVKPQQ